MHHDQSLAGGFIFLAILAAQVAVIAIVAHRRNRSKAAR